MTYELALQKIHSLDKFGSRPGLDRIGRMFDIIGDDLLHQKFIHIAGTNGKGSVCQMLSNVLRCSGYKTGLFISPYITDFRERIQINNQMVSQDVLTHAVEHMMPICDKLNSDGIIITEFEFLTAVAFYIFKHQSCDIIVCETGLGGLLDSTNLIKKPLCSVLTKIDFDHTNILGDTIQQITHQKCGIIKDTGITVSSVQSDICTDIIRDTAARKHNQLYFADDVVLDNIIMHNDKTEFTYDNTPITLNLLGEHQIDNAKTAICTLQALKQNGIIDYTSNDLHNGFSDTVNPARYELMGKKPQIILDGAHNTNGMMSFKISTIRYTESPRILVIGMLSDKDVDNAVAMLHGMFDTVVVTNVDNPRNMDANLLGKICKKYFDNVIISPVATVAFDTALNIAKQTDSSISICGSLYLASQLRPHILDKLKK